MPTSLGAHSPKLASVRALLSNRGRRERERFAFEGPTLLAEALASGIEPEAVFVSESGYASLGRAGLAERLECPVYLVGERPLQRISDLQTPPGVVTVARQRLQPIETVLAGSGPVLLLAGIADPGNAGTLLRSAEIFGATGVLFAGNAVEPYNPKVVRASMGAIFRLPLARSAPAAALETARQRGYAVVAADRGGTPIADFDFPTRLVVAIGHERRGVPGSLPDWDFAVAIPQAGGGESLNAAVAGSIILYELSLRTGPGARGLSTRKTR